ncbi:MAG: sulfite exporter TauE/SafE family protein [Merdibacter sp.]
MEITLQTFLIVCPFVFLAGCVDAIAGGGGLISLPAYFLAGVPPHMAIATNKLSSSIGTLTASFRFYKERFIKLDVICRSRSHCAVRRRIESVIDGG